MTGPVKVDMSVTSAKELVTLLMTGARIESDGFHFSADEPVAADADVWVTNPYGLDCALFPLNETGCGKIKQLVETYVDFGEANQLMGVV